MTSNKTTVELTLPAPTLTLEKDSRYRVGSLHYTRSGLVMVFVWLLWGDFCFTLMETVIPSVLPLKLQSLQTSNIVISLVISIIPSTMNFMVNPVVSFKSDRYRGKWGRRMPFLLFATPFLTFFLILMGYSEDIGRGLYGPLSKMVTVAPVTVTLILIGVFMVGFQFFNMFVGSVYFYLFNDVVPDAFMSRFMSVFRMLGLAASGFYNLFIYRYAATHMKEIFLGAALLYFVSFMVICLKIREGEYPPPPENIGRRKGVWASAKTYLSECFTHRFYWHFFLANGFRAMSGTIGIFGVFLSLSLGLTLDQLGMISGWSQLAIILLLFPAGILADRYHPIRVMFFSIIGMTLLGTFGLVYLLADLSPRTVLILQIVYTCLLTPFDTLYVATEIPMYMKLLPKERYGQFGSANAMVRSFAVIAGGFLAGGFMDLMKHHYHGDPFYYRYIPVWNLFFQLVSFIFMVLVYRGWKRHGGMHHYAPPDVDLISRSPYRISKN